LAHRGLRCELTSCGRNGPKIADRVEGDRKDEIVAVDQIDIAHAAMGATRPGSSMTIVVLLLTN
jgi:hypothetical protein